MNRSARGTIGWSLLALAASLLMPLQASAQPASHTIFGLVQGTNELIRFNSATPGTIDATIPISGLVTGETLRGIDFRPATGQLFGIGVDVAGAQARLYTINLATGVATGFAPVAGVGLTPGTQWGMGFNPVVDRVRVVNNAGENLRLNPNNGTLAGNDTNLTGTVPPVVDAVAYDRDFAGATQTTLFAINRATNSFARQGSVDGVVSPPPGSPNAGAITDIGPLGVTIGASSTALQITTTGTIFAALRPTGGSESLYTINSASGAATLVGAIGRAPSSSMASRCCRRRSRCRPAPAATHRGSASISSSSRTCSAAALSAGRRRSTASTSPRSSPRVSCPARRPRAR